jgi:hypothetical protein
MVNLAISTKEYSISGRPTLLRRIQTPTGPASARAPFASYLRDPCESRFIHIAQSVSVCLKGVTHRGTKSFYTEHTSHRLQADVSSRTYSYILYSLTYYHLSMSNLILHTEYIQITTTYHRSRGLIRADPV